MRPPDGTQEKSPPAAPQAGGSLGVFAQSLLVELAVRATAVWLPVNATKGFERVAHADAEGEDLFQTPGMQQVLPPLFADVLQKNEPRVLIVQGLIERGAKATLILMPLLQGPQIAAMLAAVAAEELSGETLQQQAMILSIRGNALIAQMFAVQTAPPPTPVPEIVSQMPASPAPRAGRPVDPHVVLEFILALQRSLDLNEVSNVAVNEGRMLFGVDRVSLVVQRGRKSVITAVSGQESVHPRGNLIRTMRTLAEQVIKSGEPFRDRKSVV